MVKTAGLCPWQTRQVGQRLALLPFPIVPDPSARMLAGPSPATLLS